MRDLTTEQARELCGLDKLHVHELCWITKLKDTFGDLLFNHDIELVSNNSLPQGGLVFFRSDSPFKKPAGSVIGAKKAQRLADRLGPHHVAWASTKPLGQEIRVYWQPSMGSKHVAVGAHPKRFLGCATSVEHYSIEMLKEKGFPFVLDFALVDGRLSILEMNVPEASGLYGDFKW